MSEISLYHVSFDISEPLNKMFYPRIPEEPMNGEDETQKRICFSDSILGCVNATGKLLEATDDSDSIEIIVWELKVDELNENLASWQTLYYKGFVPDAAITHEYWYQDNIRLKGQHYRVLDVEHTMRLRKDVKIIKPRYKKRYR